MLHELTAIWNVDIEFEWIIGKLFEKIQKLKLLINSGTARLRPHLNGTDSWILGEIVENIFEGISEIAK